MGESGNSQDSEKKDLKANILASGIPLEMAAYGVLASALDVDWIEPEYDFTTLDETGRVKQHSLDFVASVPTSRDPLNADSIHLYILAECKYSNPKERVWLFISDAFPKKDSVFDDWRPALWQDRAPKEPISTQEIECIVSRGSARDAATDQAMPRCVRGAVLGERDGKRLPSLASAMYQLRDCLHHVAIERFRLFTKQWRKPAAWYLFLSWLPTRSCEF